MAFALVLHTLHVSAINTEMQVCGQASTAMPNLSYVSVLFKEAVCLEERYA